MYWFMLITLLVVVAAVALAVVGSGDGRPRSTGGGLVEAPPDMLDEPLPPDRPVGHADVAVLRLPTAVRGYRMQQVDDVLDRLGAELAERDARIAELESALAGAQAVAIGRGESAPPRSGGPADTGPEPPGEPGAAGDGGPAGGGGQ
ncbi:DivIVA domain-containing protein [Streptomyces boncukensis]|uniref:DivIVA domain-containing protein n=1 Tax=Streptomyces boncukensis TaxID=2711219 RepID=A0A6G4WY05_9ACTN|nr:DivIVA domain-containing protein [Streptomyces boncukensis]